MGKQTKLNTASSSPIDKMEGIIFLKYEINTTGFGPPFYHAHTGLDCPILILSMANKEQHHNVRNKKVRGGVFHTSRS